MNIYGRTEKTLKTEKDVLSKIIKVWAKIINFLSKVPLQSQYFH